MTRGILEAAGGLGLFLVGMLVMTEGLHGVAGDSLQRVLRRFTRSPLAGAVTGTWVTALVQSSSVTTLSAVGFAGAGLLTFPEALGIVLGANVGTTVTGWMVAVLGFKLDLGAIMPLAVLVGALLRLLAGGRLAQGGYALAGFGLIFVGIDVLQEGMAALSTLVTPERFPGDTWLGRAELLAIGVAITLVTQSSSAGVATALAAVSAGAITLPQAAAMVIGMDVGTSAKAALATVGASLPARRTGWAHVLYNLLNGVAAFAVLPVFLAGLEHLAPGTGARDPELALVAFHTFFNLVGVMIVLPVARPFASLVEWLVPERPGPFTRRLDRSLLATPELALHAVAPTLDDLAAKSFEVLRGLLRDGERAPHPAEAVALLEIAVEEVQQYLAGLSPGGSEARRNAALHVLDQLRRLLDRLEQRDRPRTVAAEPELRDRAARLAALLPEAGGRADAAALAALERELEAREPRFRQEAIARARPGALHPDAALDRMDAFRWLEHVTHHVGRIAHHAARLREEAPGPSLEPLPPSLEKPAPPDGS